METAEKVKMHDVLLASMPDGAKHDSDICPICVDKATELDSSTSRIPPAVSGGPDVSDHQSHQTSTEGGTPNTMSENANNISQETHTALLQKAVSDATSVTEKALETAQEEAKGLASKVEKLEADNAGLKADNDRLNKELDTAQVSLKAATDEVASLKDDIAAKDEAAQKAEIASKRADQIRNLGLFDDTYVAEKASSWADVAEEDWAERVTEWQKLKPAKVKAEGEKTTETASAMSGTSEGLTKEPETDAASAQSKPVARRAALGLS